MPDQSALTTSQNGVQALNTIADALNSQVPHFTSGQLSVNAVILPTFTRVTGISVVTGGTAGGLYDAATVQGAASTTQVYVVPTTAGFTAVNMVFQNGLVYKPGSGQVAAFFYAKT